VSARVYDKSFEALQERGQLIPPTTRYEVTATRHVGATLRDAAEPGPLFFHFASPSLLEAPPGVPPWESRESCAWEYQKPDLTPFEVLKRRVERSPDLAALEDLAATLGDEGRLVLARLIARRLLGASAQIVANH
jgi:hypothetical protein